MISLEIRIAINIWNIAVVMKQFIFNAYFALFYSLKQWLWNKMGNVVQNLSPYCHNANVAEIL